MDQPASIAANVSARMRTNAPPWMLTITGSRPGLALGPVHEHAHVGLAVGSWHEPLFDIEPCAVLVGELHPLEDLGRPARRDRQQLVLLGSSIPIPQSALRQSGRSVSFQRSTSSASRRSALARSAPNSANDTVASVMPIVAHGRRGLCHRARDRARCSIVAHDRHWHAHEQRVGIATRRRPARRATSRCRRALRRARLP